MGALPGTRPTGPALKAASVAGGPEVSTAANMQRQKIAAIKAKRKPVGSGSTPATRPEDIPTTEELNEQRDTPPPASPGGGPPAAFTDQRGAPGWYRSTASTLADPVAAGNAGGGFLLGLALWAVTRAYLNGGSDEVRKLLAAKFLNRVATS